MRAFALAAVVALVVPLAGQVSDTWEARLERDRVGLPGGPEIALRFLQAGNRPFTTGRWRTTFAETFSWWGDSAGADYDVEVRATRPPEELLPVYHYRMAVAWGSTACDSVCVWGLNFRELRPDGTLGGPVPDGCHPSQAEIRRRQEAGECPSLVLRVWQVRVGER